MMAETPNDQSLGTRLDRLSLEEETFSLSEFQQMADEIRRDPGFERSVLRAGALANEKRLVTLALLEAHGSLCACEIQAALDCTNATVSHHMSCLEEAALVTAEKRGKWKHYQLTQDGERLFSEVTA